MPITRVGTASVRVPAGSFTITPAAVAGVTAGDLLICTETHGRSGGAAHTATSWPGWTSIYVGTTGNALNTAIIYRIADGTAGDQPPAISWSGNGAAAVALSVAYRGVSGSAPFVAQQTEAVTTSGTDLMSAVVTTAVAGSWGLYFGAYRGVVSPASFQQPIGLTELLDVDAGLGSTNNSVATIADSAGSLGPDSYQWTGVASAAISANAGRTWAALLASASTGLTVVPDPISNTEFYAPVASGSLTATPTPVAGQAPAVASPAAVYPGQANPAPIASQTLLAAPRATSVLTSTPGVAGILPIVYEPRLPVLVGPDFIGRTGGFGSDPFGSSAFGQSNPVPPPSVTFDYVATPAALSAGPTMRAPAAVPQARDLQLTVVSVTTNRQLAISTEYRRLTTSVTN